MNNIEAGLDALDTLVNQMKNLPEGTLINGRILPSVTSNNLTLALKTFAGTDPSASDPVLVVIGGVVRVITAALSVTKNAGTNWMNLGGAELAANEVDLFARLGYNATDGVVIGFNADPSARIYSDFNTTSTNEKYCAISTITNAAANDPYPIIGRFAATLSAGAGYTWTVPTFTAKNLIQRPIYETRLLTYTPTWSNVTLGNSTNTGEYRIREKELYCHVRLTIGNSGASVTGNMSFTLAKTCESFSTGTVRGHGYFLDSGVASYAGQPQQAASSGTTINCQALNAAGTYATQTFANATVPFSWGAADMVDFEIPSIPLA
jgi:hypothetical protein